MAIEPFPKLSARQFSELSYQDKNGYFEYLLTQPDGINTVLRLVQNNPQLLSLLPNLVNQLPKDSPLRKQLDEARGVGKSDNEVDPNNPKQSNRNSDSREANSSTNGGGRITEAAITPTHILTTIAAVVTTVFDALPPPVRTVVHVIGDLVSTYVVKPLQRVWDGAVRKVQDGWQTARKVGGQLIAGARQRLSDMQKFVDERVRQWHEVVAKIESFFGPVTHSSEAHVRADAEREYRLKHPQQYTTQLVAKPVAHTKPSVKKTTDVSGPAGPSNGRPGGRQAYAQLKTDFSGTRDGPSTPLPRYRTLGDTTSTPAPPPSRQYAANRGGRSNTGGPAAPGMSGPGMGGPSRSTAEAEGG